MAILTAVFACGPAGAYDYQAEQARRDAEMARQRQDDEMRRQREAAADYAREQQRRNQEAANANYELQRRNQQAADTAREQQRRNQQDADGTREQQRRYSEDREFFERSQQEQERLNRKYLELLEHNSFERRELARLMATHGAAGALDEFQRLHGYRLPGLDQVVARDQARGAVATRPDSGDDISEDVDPEGDEVDDVDEGDLPVEDAPQR